ncbi:hypothetical protein L6164_016569 [Bauhinia variegata]|uniref:Uncharacterized protein n=1 Tax=Bauhinia variegata TaxID=167791 RepID=A0ACB9NV69_BAUVA|nr:hypothetical protein L6164_016569 [Bauhinia variegata]
MTAPSSLTECLQAVFFNSRDAGFLCFFDRKTIAEQSICFAELEAEEATQRPRSETSSGSYSLCGLTTKTLPEKKDHTKK